MQEHLGVSSVPEYRVNLMHSYSFLEIQRDQQLIQEMLLFFVAHVVA